MKEGTFAGKSWQGSGRLKIIREEEKKRVFIDDKPYMSWSATDNESQRMAIAQISELEIVSEEELARVFEVHVRSVRNYIQGFRREGIQGLVSQKSGPKAAWKVNPSLKSKILLIVLKYDIFKYETIQERLKDWGEGHVSTWIIGKVLVENGIAEEKIHEVEEGIQQGLLFKDVDEDQLHLDFAMKREWAFVAQKSDKEETKRKAGEEKIDLSESEVEKYRRSYSHSQRIYLDRLEQGEYSAYAGGLLFVPLLERYVFLPTLKKIIDINTHEGFSFEQLCLTLLYMDVFGFRSMEDFKRAYREEFGMLIGQTYCPSHFTLRRFLHKIRQLNKGEELIEEFAHEYLKRGIARWGVLYIDGHFFPYYGMFSIAKGWHGVRKVPMKGSYHFLAVDEDFVPWIFLVRSSSEDLLQKIPEIIEKAKRIGKAVGLQDKQLENMIVIFDREGYSGKLYSYLDGREIDGGKGRVLFISWAKYSKWVYEISEEKLDNTVIVEYKIQKAKEYKYWETERKMSKYGKIRTIVVQRETDKKRAAIYTNASKEELETEKAVHIICRRWGEENLIKMLMEKHFINYTPGYVTEEIAEQPMVDNPEVVKLKNKKAALSSNLHKAKVQFTDKVLKEANDETPLKEIKHNQLSLLEDIVKIEKNILFMDLEIDKLPSEVPFDQAHNGKRMGKQNYEKKRFLDCIKVFACNMEMKMCEILLNYYDAKKEIFPVLSMIVNRGGYIKLQGGELRVRLKRFKNRAIDYAARHLCEELNTRKPVTLDKFELPIYYEVR